MPIFYKRIFKLSGWEDYVTPLAIADVALLTPSPVPAADLNFWDDAALPWASFDFREDLNLFDDVLDGFMEDAAWSDTTSIDVVVV